MFGQTGELMTHRKFLRACLVLFLSVSAGCSDYSIGELKEEQTDTGLDAPTIVEREVCVTLETCGQISDPGLGWTNETVCSASGGGIWGDVGYRTLVAFEVTGSAARVPPDYVRVVAQDCTSGVAEYPAEENYRSANDISASTTASGWEVNSTLLGNLNSCYPNCDWCEAVLEIQDDDAVANDDCGSYEPSSSYDPIELCLIFQEASGARSAPVDSTCVAGSGRFQLIPRRLIDRDDDSSSSVILSPVQVSGSGALTGHAWITDLDIVEDQDQDLRVIKPNAQFRFDSADTLVDQAVVSLPLQATNDFTSGAVSGGAPFVAVEILDTTTADFVVDLQWTCGTLPPSAERVPYQGYTVSPEDLGCTCSWVQELTVRPFPHAVPKYLDIERYGHVEDRVRVRLEAVPAGHDFDHRIGTLRLRGTLTSYDSNSATIDLDEASVDGVNICTTGTYTLPAED